MKKDEYLDYLFKLAGKKACFKKLIEHLHSYEFYSLVSNDRNRIIDGQEFRQKFLAFGGPHGSSFLPDFDCSILEMLLGVSKRIEFDLYGSRHARSLSDWFWVLIDNLELSYCDNTDYVRAGCRNEVDEKLARLLEREYSFNGEGGIFPLKSPREDQRNVEIWYQMSDWMSENFSIL